MNRFELNSVEIKEIARHLILTNKMLQVENKKPIAFSIEGPAGLGKSSVVKQAAEELGITNYHAINLAQLDELGDLVGIPIKEYLMTITEDKKVKSVWVDERVIDDYKAKGFSLLNKSRMNYALPLWLAGKGENGILVLDDYTR